MLRIRRGKTQSSQKNFYHLTNHYIQNILICLVVRILCFFLFFLFVFFVQNETSFFDLKAITGIKKGQKIIIYSCYLYYCELINNQLDKISFKSVACFFFARLVLVFKEKISKPDFRVILLCIRNTLIQVLAFYNNIRAISPLF